MVERQKAVDDDRASIVEQITAGSKKLKQGFETHAENLKDLMAQSCRAGMARLSDLEVKAEELEAELASQQDMEDRVSENAFRTQLTISTLSVLVKRTLFTMTVHHRDHMCKDRFQRSAERMTEELTY